MAISKTSTLDQWLLDNAESQGFDVSGLTDRRGRNKGFDLGGFLKSYLYDPETGAVNPAGIGAGIYGLYKMFGSGDDIKTGGWSAPPPKLTATRSSLPAYDPNRRPGSMGQRYFTDVQYTPQGNADALASAQANAQSQAQSLMAARPTYSAPVNPYAGTFRTPWESAAAPAPIAPPAQAAYPAVPLPEQLTETGALPASGYQMAQGGQVPQFKGPLQSGGFVVPGDVVRHADPMGQANKERGLAALSQTLGAQAIRGPGDAMSDSIPTTIDGQQPAAVANGEAYVPPQQVKRAGGADKLYNMMEKLRLERTGSKKQINPDNPKELQLAYQNGGGVRRFVDGGTITSGTPGATTAAGGTQPLPYGSSTVNTLSPYIGEYVTGALGQGAAMAATPYQAYQGPLTAGPSDLQQQAFAGIQSIAGAGFTPESYSYQTGQFGGETATRYMNPYLQSALDPQLQEMRRESDISRLADAARLTKAGAYGGSRQAIMESEGRRNLLDAQRRALGEGYMTAYDKALQQYNLEQGKRLEAQGLGEKSRQYSAEYGLRSLADLASLGQTQRDIEQAGIEADKAQFEEERNYAYSMPQYQLGLLSGIPIGGNVQTSNTTGAATLSGQVKDILGVYGELEKIFK